jgi:hypothetical protein
MIIFIIRLSAQHKNVLQTGDFFTLGHFTFDSMIRRHFLYLKYIYRLNDFR